jgi:HJR/Mrr/RecB family endonuclease
MKAVNSQAESSVPQQRSATAAPEISQQAAAIAEQQFIAAKAMRKSAAARCQEAKRSVQYRRVRLWVAQRGLSDWVLALIGGSATAVVLGVLVIFLFDAAPALILIAILAGYLACGGAIHWFFRDLKGETDQDRVQARTDQMRFAEGRLHAAVEALADKTAAQDRALQQWRSIQQALQSDAHKYQLETNRLLSVDPGRLYPDEFEHYVADIFKHLGFTIEVTGRSGDQGVDVLACKGQLRLAIQAKRHIGSVGNTAVQEVFAGMAHHRCHRCVVITNSGFTPGAIALAQSTGCILVDGDLLPACIRGELTL